MLPAGRLRHRISVQQLTVRADEDTGVRTEEWMQVHMLPAEVVPLSGRELVAAQSVQSKVTTRIRTRYRNDVNASHRIVHGCVTYNVEAIVPDPVSGRQHMTLLCSSGTSDG
jgi:SPP1 family predicted phage head-tail adaptor